MSGLVSEYMSEWVSCRSSGLMSDIVNGLVNACVSG